MVHSKTPQKICRSLCLCLLFLLSSCSLCHHGHGLLGVFDRNPCQGCLVLMEKDAPPPKHPERIYYNVALDAGNAGCARASLSLPWDVDPQGLPCVIILGGIDMGRDSLEYLPKHGDYALLAFEYPEELRDWGNGPSFFKAGALRRTTHRIPGQVLVLAEWARRQEWCDGEPISLFGLSLGGIFLAPTQHLAQAQCHELGPSVIAYSGACLYHIINANLTLPKIFRPPVALAATALLNNTEPSRHLPCLEGEFLVIEGRCDEQMPPCSRARLRNCVPEPKTIITLDTKHITPESTEIIEELYEISKEWLDERREWNKS